MMSRLHPVAPSYFATLGVTLLRGRFFTEAENRLDAPPVIVVDDELAKRYFPNEDPLGKRLTFGVSHSVTGAAADTVRMRGEIVGVIKHVVYDRLGETPEAAAYFPYATAPFGATFVVRADGDPRIVETEIARVMRSSRDLPAPRHNRQSRPFQATRSMCSRASAPHRMVDAPRTPGVKLTAFQTSARNADAGDERPARRAGTALATTPTIASTAEAPMSVGRSHERVGARGRE
jgi:hypothetical protein